MKEIKEIKNIKHLQDELNVLKENNYLFLKLPDFKGRFIENNDIEGIIEECSEILSENIFNIYLEQDNDNKKFSLTTVNKKTQLDKYLNLHNLN